MDLSRMTAVIESLALYPVGCAKINARPPGEGYNLTSTTTCQTQQIAVTSADSLAACQLVAGKPPVGYGRGRRRDKIRELCQPWTPFRPGPIKWSGVT